jgi:hypothetical protein
MRILTIFVRYGQTSYPDSFERLQTFYLKNFKGIDPDFIIVDNELPINSHLQAQSNVCIIGGSNKYWEFSGFDDAVSYIGKNILNYDVVHIVTSAFGELYTDYIDKISISMLIKLNNRSFVLGHIDHYNDEVLMLDNPFQCWIRSCFFFIKPADLLLLGKFVSITNGDHIYSQDFRAPFNRPSVLSDNYQAYLLNWLTSDGTGQGVQWHSKFDLSNETLGYFKAKSLNIQQEHMLSIRFRRAGINLIDATWLYGFLKVKPNLLSKSYRFPLWKDQVRDRFINF